MKRFAMAIPLLLSACAVGSYRPYVMDIRDSRALIDDEATCRIIAQAWKSPLDLTGIANSTVQGAAKNAAGAAVSPWAPVLGGAGGASSTILQDLGLSSDAQVRIFLHCLAYKGQKSGAYVVIDPNL